MRATWLVCVTLLMWLTTGCGGGPMAAKEAPMHASGGVAMDAERMEMEEADYGDEAAFAPGPMEPPPAPAADVTRTAQAQPGEAGGGKGKPQPAEAKPDVQPVTTPAPKAPVATEKVTPLLIYTAHFHMAVFESKKAIDAVDQLAKDMGGYLVRRDQNSITVRVPAKKYRGALESIGKLGDVLHREETVEDVTDQFYDLMTRIKNARAMRDRLEELLKQAKNVKEALAVERELGRVTGEIERMEGRLKRLRELISFSTITVDFKPRPVENIDSNVRLPFNWLNQLGLSNLLNL